ncbi:hypothetical protein K488DRAFT_50214 [Vararia minispora EC-137]|uniref:Uncharacterized protein n=1 Tax=Vararia minispora EC-137 TaxID=1314806 RepID=A0ACB8QKU2_9AGAM|nr:hypothetical protein K488DRAFT_50214 [Vararia minispora EC-137]
MTTPLLPVISVHTPTSSFAIVHKLAEENITSLFDKLSRKHNTEFYGKRVGPGWLKYEWNGTIWSLDDDSDYTIFTWRHTGSPDQTPSYTFHLRDPSQPLPLESSYRNPSFYLHRPQPSLGSVRSSSRPGSIRSKKSSRSRAVGAEDDGVPKHKKDFEGFHSANGVRTVMGSIGPVQNVRMLLKAGYRHVYISRKFAMRHGFIPADAAPGHYGYEGLVNIGKWPITVGKTKTTHTVYLAEENHFDVVLGRAFQEKRLIKIDPVDPTDVVCLDTGEKLECELVILKDGRGEIVTVT